MPDPLTPAPEGAIARAFPIQRYGTIPWSVAQVAYAEYARQFGTSQSLERLAERGGFGVGEMDMFHPKWREEVHEIGKLRAALAAKDARIAELEGDNSIGDVIAAEGDGTIHLDDGVQTHSYRRACEYLAKENGALRAGLAFDPIATRERLAEAERLLKRAGLSLRECAGNIEDVIDDDPSLVRGMKEKLRATKTDADASIAKLDAFLAPRPAQEQEPRT